MTKDWNTCKKLSKIAIIKKEIQVKIWRYLWQIMQLALVHKEVHQINLQEDLLTQTRETQLTDLLQLKKHFSKEEMEKTRKMLPKKVGGIEIKIILFLI